MKVYRRRYVRADPNAAAPSARARPTGGVPIAGCSAMLYSPTNAASSPTATFPDDADVRGARAAHDARSAEPAVRAR
jgi:hypothetical protein